MELPKKLPPIGARIIKSSVAVALCMVVYHIRTLLPIGNGLPFYSALSALWCLQPYPRTTKNNAGQRTIGTFTGALYGLIFIILMKSAGATTPVLVYLAASVFIIPVIYTTVILDKRSASFFSCVVFLSIALTHSFDDDPYLFVFNRVLDTFIGIVIGLGVNNFYLPVKHDSETLYVSGIDQVLIPDNISSMQFSKVELNRLIESGVRFTVSTIHTPAEIVEIMDGVELRLPLIVMDGAALYDIKNKEYIEAEFLDTDICRKAERIISSLDLHCFVNVLFDSTLLIFYGNFRNEAERTQFEANKHSSYRNYVNKFFRHNDVTEKILYLTVLAEQDKVRSLKEKLKADLGTDVRITVYDSEYNGYMYLRVLSPLASKQIMMAKLKAHTGAEKIVTFGSIKGKYDVYIGDGGGNATVKKLKKLYRTDVLH